MNRTVTAGERYGTVRAVASKSMAHRLLIGAALSSGETQILCEGFSKDILATANCLNALGAQISFLKEGKIAVRPIKNKPEGLCRLPCGESGSTIRFLLPVVGALGVEAVFEREGRLPERPLYPLDRELTAHGMTLCEKGKELFVSGKLQAGEFTLPGDVSSQFVSGLLFALPLLSGNSRLTVSGRVESADYIALTEDVLEKNGVLFTKTQQTYEIEGSQEYHSPKTQAVEGDYSNAAFFLVLGALSKKGVTLTGLDPDSKQGDKRILSILSDFGAEVFGCENGITVRRGHLRGKTVDVAAIPDLVPVLSVLAAVSEGQTRFVNAARLRLKESNRLEGTAEWLGRLGADIFVEEDCLVVRGKPQLQGHTINSFSDHRVAMAAAVAAAVCQNEVVVEDALCVEKSYPKFWADFDGLEVDS